MPPVFADGTIVTSDAPEIFTYGGPGPFVLYLFSGGKLRYLDGMSTLMLYDNLTPNDPRIRVIPSIDDYDDNVIGPPIVGGMVVAQMKGEGQPDLTQLFVLDGRGQKRRYVSSAKYGFRFNGGLWPDVLEMIPTGPDW